MPSTPDEQRLEEARGYLADYLYDEDIHGEESQDWFAELGNYVEELLPDDPLILKAATYLQPFLDDDERIECAMYPNGEAVKYIDQGWGGDLRSYLAGLLNAMGHDHARWEAIVAERGQAARWILAK
jgi:hypothetical protein